jgi:hypothetical protein
MGSNFNADDINHFLQQLGRPTHQHGQAPYFGYGHDPRWAPPVTDGHLLDDSDYSQYDDAQSEYTTVSAARSETTTIRSAAPPSLFSTGRSTATRLTTPSRGPGVPRMSFVEQFHTPGAGPSRPDQILWCEFAGLLDCRATFRLDDEARWIQHHVDHLGDHFPQALMCWFCDHVPFVAAGPADAFANFDERMQHVRGHIFSDHRWTAENARPDFYVVAHLYERGLLSERMHRHAMSFNETPHAYRLPGEREHGQHAPSHHRPLGQRMQGQFHDLDRERRHRQRERQGHGRR